MNIYHEMKLNQLSPTEKQVCVMNFGGGHISIWGTVQETFVPTMVIVTNRQNVMNTHIDQACNRQRRTPPQSE